MKCESCHKRQATVVVTMVVEDEKTVLHLCAQCAKDKNLDSGLSSDEEAPPIMDQQAAGSERSDVDDKLRCPSCGLTYTRFKERYRLGCADCYVAFRDRLSPLLRKVQGTDSHVGKRFAHAPVSEAREQRPIGGAWTLGLLRRRLNAAVEREEFEEAARLRDQIEALNRAQSKESESS